MTCALANMTHTITPSQQLYCVSWLPAAAAALCGLSDAAAETVQIFGSQPP
jgi:hypothetical protein